MKDHPRTYKRILEAICAGQPVHLPTVAGYSSWDEWAAEGGRDACEAQAHTANWCATKNLTLNCAVVLNLDTATQCVQVEPLDLADADRKLAAEWLAEFQSFGWRWNTKSDEDFETADSRCVDDVRWTSASAGGPKPVWYCQSCGTPIEADLNCDAMCEACG